ncbi:MAG: hypothetical protein ABH882_06045 [Candidatus Omnitrophota bacterium]|nr:ATP-binding protein [Candidatus Omnitrophota bacterium]MBU1929102.1 ATP-binding protein [Candidatus Omnitrophota bacterium]MBU1929147.1 ATP-binding protein [Candidatus Omnitrophota bacterium]MBU2035027.1 ATP-binding protein [Candidatus Omnitrophota bacterium]MBU2221835.1 ATP-binding protein [Candidatus Omnitrophota bacterium]
MNENNIFGRQVYLDILEKRINDFKEGYRQNIAIIGDESIGKTSLVFEFLRKFYDNSVITVYLEVRPESLATFGKRFIGVLLYNFLVNSNINLKEDLDFLINKSYSYIPKTVDKIRVILKDLEKRKKDNIFFDLLSLCDLIYQETGKLSLVIMDEFHNFDNAQAKKLYSEWSKSLMVQKNTMYIILSSSVCRARALLSKELSLLFGNFQVVEIEPFDAQTTEEYLSLKLEGINIDPELKNFLAHFTAGHPFYLEIIANLLLKSPQVDLVDLLEDIIFESSGILNQRFHNYLKRFESGKHSDVHIAILYSVSRGQNKIKDLVHITHTPKKELESRINYLLSVDALSRNGDFLKINDRVFSFWLRFVYQQKLRSFTYDAQNQKSVFRKNIEDMVGEFLNSSGKSVFQRVKELLNLFADDSIQIEKKRLKLTHFREIKKVEFTNRGIREGLVCRSGESLWIIAFKPDVLNEIDISEFARECKKFRYRLQKKIIITMREMDANSRLRALEEKIMTWDVDNLNQILDLYSRPRIAI